ncbi:MAG: hypothetical protein IPP56_11175 [Bacteroidetes bacterium]|nr:hypothetical protein [Bacteroidota bacterium]MBK9800233.1 hypothetical protein [Bacteroidota bacterium]
MIEFNDEGFLIPVRVHKMSLNHFYKTFIIKMEKREVRQRRWCELLDFIAFIKKHGIEDTFHMVIGGSLVRNHKDPADIDIIMIFTLVDYQKLSSIGVFDYLSKNSQEIFNIQIVCFMTVGDYKRIMQNNTTVSSIFNNSIKGTARIKI